LHNSSISIKSLAYSVALNPWILCKPSINKYENGKKNNRKLHQNRKAALAPGFKKKNANFCQSQEQIVWKKTFFSFHFANH